MATKCPNCHSENPDTAQFCEDCGAPLAPSAKPEVSVTETLEIQIEGPARGTLFAGRYEIIEELGRGGMGSVYRVYDKKIKEEVALKLIKPEIVADRKTVERFTNEIRLARKIAHRNVCKIYELMEEGGTHFITMEYVPGEDMRRWLNRSGMLRAEMAVGLAKQICEGLSEAHRLGIIHRDLKPSNVMIDKEGNARIMDFGIARTLISKSITGEGMIIGTPDYMSPEQVDGRQADPGMDIYSLGVILYEMVTGKLPFEGDTALVVAMKHKTEIPKPPREINPQLSKDLNSLILKCLEKDKEARYQSAEDLLAELTAIETGMPIIQRKISSRRPFVSRAAASRRVAQRMLIPALIVTALVIVGLILWRSRSREAAISVPPEKPSLAVLYFKNNTGDDGLDHWRSALSDLLIADLSQSKYVRILSGASLFNILSQLGQLEAASYSSQVLKEVGSRGQSQYVLLGDFAKAGNEFRINVMLHEAETAELIGSETVEGSGEHSFFSMVDELTRRIKTHFLFPAGGIERDIDEDVTKITTSSPEAYKNFSQGSQFYRKGEYRKCIECMEKAVAVDPEFAMAYRTMAYAYQTLGYIDEREKYLQKALDLKSRISERERYLIEGDFYRQSENTAQLAVDAYKRLLDIYPEEWIGNLNLGIIYNDFEQWDEALEQFELAGQNPTAAYFSSLYKAQTLAALGMYDKADEALRKYIHDFSDNATSRWYLAQNYVYQGEYDLALEEAGRAASLNPAMYQNFILQGDIYHLKGDLEKAEQEYKKLLQIEEQAANMYGMSSLAALYLREGRFEGSIDQLKQALQLSKKLEQKSMEFSYLRYLASMYARSGNFKEALNVIKEARRIALETEDLTEQKSVLYDQAAILAEMKSANEALQAVNELKRMISKSINQKEMRYYYYLCGLIELAQDDSPSAIKNFHRALSMIPSQYAINNEHALFMDGLAFAYYQAGEIESARLEYEKIKRLTVSRLYYGDIYAKSFYRLGKIYEQQGDQSEAASHYEKFLDMWKDADPGISEVEEARKSLALTASNSSRR